MSGKKKITALAGSRTRIYCLEGNNANRYTTNALLYESVNHWLFNTVPYESQLLTDVMLSVLACPLL